MVRVGTADSKGVLVWSMRAIYTRRMVTAKLFLNGRSQAVRLPREFRFSGDRVRLRRIGDGVMLEPITPVSEWFAQLDRFGLEDFMPEGREQPEMPPDEDLF